MQLIQVYKVCRAIQKIQMVGSNVFMAHLVIMESLLADGDQTHALSLEDILFYVCVCACVCVCMCVCVYVCVCVCVYVGVIQMQLLAIKLLCV